MSKTEMQNFGLQMYNLKGAVKINMYHLTPPSDQVRMRMPQYRLPAYQGHNHCSDNLSRCQPGQQLVQLLAPLSVTEKCHPKNGLPALGKRPFQTYRASQDLADSICAYLHLHDHLDTLSPSAAQNCAQ